MNSDCLTTTPTLPTTGKRSTNRPMRILVLGAGGMLGTDLLQEWKSDELLPARSADADIRDLAQVRALIARTRPDWIVLAAAYTDVDGSERYPERADSVNTPGTAKAARGGHRHGPWRSRNTFRTYGCQRSSGFANIQSRPCGSDSRAGPDGFPRSRACHKRRFLFVVRVCSRSSAPGRS